MAQFLQRYAGPGFVFLAGVALQLSGVTNRTLAVFVMALAVLWVVVVRFPELKRMALRRPPLPPEPVPEAPPQALFTITLPSDPRPGHIDSNRTVMFERVYVVTSATRELRFTLESPGREFLGFAEYHELWTEQAAKSPDFAAKYLPNPAHIPFPNRLGDLAFVDLHGAQESVGAKWTMTIDTGQDLDRRHFVLSEVGEWTCFSDGAVAPAR